MIQCVNLKLKVETLILWWWTKSSVTFWKAIIVFLILHRCNDEIFLCAHVSIHGKKSLFHRSCLKVQDIHEGLILYCCKYKNDILCRGDRCQPHHHLPVPSYLRREARTLTRLSWRRNNLDPGLKSRYPLRRGHPASLNSSTLSSLRWGFVWVYSNIELNSLLIWWKQLMHNVLHL